MCDAGQVALTQQPNKQMEVFADISYLSQMCFKRDACSNAGGGRDKSSFMGRLDKNKNASPTVSRCYLNPTGRSRSQTPVTETRQSKRCSGSATLKEPGGILVETRSQGSVLGDQDSPSSSVSSPDLRLRGNFTDIACGESRSRLRRAGVRAPSAEPNGTRIHACLRACTCVCACAYASERLYCYNKHGQINNGEDDPVLEGPTKV